MIDIHAYIGAYPFRHLPHPEPRVLVQVLEREGLDGAWVGHLPSAFYRDPEPGNEDLFASLAPYADRLRAVPCLRPDWPHWERAFASVVARDVPAVRAYPPQWGLSADDAAMRALCGACGEAGIALVLTARFEDLRQRHWMDTAGDLSAAAVRALARGNTRTRIVVGAAGRGLVEEVHWGLTPAERENVFWDISWLWGPPEHELALLFRTVGSERFVYGTAWPLRLAQTPRASLALLPDDLVGSPLANPAAWAT
jgi:predicted TIM-barrel fold metal-dependent hydrolase